MTLKSGRNKKCQKMFQLHRFLNPFSQLPTVKKDSKKGSTRNFFGPSCFVMALIYLILHIHNLVVFPVPNEAKLCQSYVSRRKAKSKKKSWLAWLSHSTQRSLLEYFGFPNGFSSFQELEFSFEMMLTQGFCYCWIHSPELKPSPTSIHNEARYILLVINLKRSQKYWFV